MKIHIHQKCLGWKQRFLSNGERNKLEKNYLAWVLDTLWEMEHFNGFIVQNCGKPMEAKKKQKTYMKKLKCKPWIAHKNMIQTQTRGKMGVQPWNGQWQMLLAIYLFQNSFGTCSSLCPVTLIDIVEPVLTDFQLRSVHDSLKADDS